MQLPPYLLNFARNLKEISMDTIPDTRVESAVAARQTGEGSLYGKPADLSPAEEKRAVEIGKTIFTGNTTLGEAVDKAIAIVKQNRGR